MTDSPSIWRHIAQAATGVWFRRIEVVGRDRLPDEGPAVLVGSHFNGLLDIALVAAVTTRFPRFLAASAFWRNPVFARLLDSAGALPVYRSKKGESGSNEEMFEACHRALCEGTSIALFPEGTTHDEPRIAGLRTGAARIALGARERGARGIRIVPVGLIYTAKSRPRSRALVRVGEPIDLDRDLAGLAGPEADEPTAVKALTTEIHRRLADAALDYEDADVGLAAAYAGAIALRPAGVSRHWEPSLDAVERCARALTAAPPELQRRVVEAFMLYHDSLTLLGVRDEHLVAGDLTPAAMRRRLGGLAAVATGLPVAALGVTVNGPALGLVWAAGRLMRSGPMRGTARIMTGLVALPLTWIGLRWRLSRRGLREPTLAAAAAGPGAGLVALSLIERARALRRARESARRLREQPHIVPILWSERTLLVESVADALESVGESDLLPAPVDRPDLAGQPDRAA
jgi:glycerol-3-phosphate O-acyltransferase / dihydroxyacetone phosphate acyltransferase